MAVVVVPVLETLGELLLATEVEGIVAETLLAGAGTELRIVATDMVLGRVTVGVSELVEGLAERSIIVETNLANVEVATELEQATLVGDIVKDPSRLAAALSDGAANSGSRGWQDIHSFVKWSASEIWDQALFQVGMEAAERILEGGGSPVLQLDIRQASSMMGSLLKPLKALNLVTNEWHQWLVSHFRKKDNYGILTADGIRQYRFELFRQKLTALKRLIDETLAPALAAATKSGSLSDYGKLKAAMGEYAGAVRKIGEGIKEREPLMARDGLKDHLAELDEAVAAIKGTSK